MLPKVVGVHSHPNLLIELVLAGSRMLLGKKVMSWQVLLPRKNTKGTWGQYGLYGTLPEAFLVSGNYRIRRKTNFRFLRMETNFRFLL